MNSFDNFTKHFAVSHFTRAFKALLGYAPACEGEPCGGPTFACHPPCRCIRSLKQCHF